MSLETFKQYNIIPYISAEISEHFLSWIRAYGTIFNNPYFLCLTLIFIFYVILCLYLLC